MQFHEDVNEEELGMKNETFKVFVDYMKINCLADQILQIDLC